MRPGLTAALAALALVSACGPQVDPARVEPVEAAQLSRQLDPARIRLIDVRSDAEVAGGMIPGAEHIPIERFDPALLDLGDGREVVFYCQAGYRSAIAADRLSHFIGRKVRHLDGGIEAWEEAGGKVISAARKPG